MKFDDEVPNISAIILAKRRLYASDIDVLIRKYEGSLARMKKHEKEIKHLRSQLDQVSRKNSSNLVLLKKSEEQARELHRKLSQLRSSKTYQLGMSMGKPVRAANRMKRQLVAARLKKQAVRSLVELSTKTSPNTAVAEVGVASAVPTRVAPTAAGRKPMPPAVPALVDEFTLIQNEQELRREKFAAEPSRGSLLSLVSHAYFSCGSLVGAATTLIDNIEFTKGCLTKDQNFMDTVLGQYSVMTNYPTIPSRQLNPVYTPEPGRVMYCAHSTGKFNSNGYSTRTAGIVSALQELGQDVFVMARPGYPWDVATDVPTPSDSRFVETISNVEHIYNPGLSWTTDRLDYYLAKSVDTYVREALRQRPSQIHAASNHITALPALIAARLLGIPFTYEVRGIWEITALSARLWWESTDRYKLAKSLETLVAKESDSVLAITSQVRNELVSRGVDREKIGLLPNAVDTSTHIPLPGDKALRNKLGIPAGVSVLGYAGSLVGYEGLSVLIEALKLVLTRGRDAKLVIVGDGKELPNLKRQATELGIAEHVIFTGRVSASEVPKYISIFDIMPCPRLLLPVTEMVSPLKPLEAMACGKAVILTDLAPLRDLAGSDGDRAILVSPGSASSLADGVMRLMDDLDLTTGMGKRARKWTVAERNWLQVSSAVIDSHKSAAVRDVFAPESIELSDLTIAVIADRFTTAGLGFEANVVSLVPDNWLEQMIEQKIDALFVESAWEGIGGQWKRKIGYYGEQEFETLKAILDFCKERAIPTLFWNKEDPVHFNRFEKTASFFDHIFTTDSNCIERYMVSSNRTEQTVSSLPFYAQPKMHNILPSNRGYRHSVNFAGSYYGNKFKVRSVELLKLLSAAEPHGLTIYDRQFLQSDSPYQFPERLARFVQGGLDYSEMVDAYKSHPVHINVNSVVDSPTMFSRRVAEIAASGGAIVSGLGQGVSETFGGLVPVVKNMADAGLLVSEWMENEETRLADAWLAYRSVHRSHTAGQRLSYALRVAGLRVSAPQKPDYAVFAKKLSSATLSAIQHQSVSPVAIYAAAVEPGLIILDGVRVVEDFAEAMRLAKASAIPWLGKLTTGIPDRTVFEDMLSTATFGDWGTISTTDENLGMKGLGMARLESPAEVSLVIESTNGNTMGPLMLRRPVPAVVVEERHTNSVAGQLPTILVAGHDLKFINPYIDFLRSSGHEVLIDQWLEHNKHDESASGELLKNADVIICEWTLGNAVWYSKNKLSHQRLITRFHSQELFRPYANQVDYDNVDKVVFVGKYISELAIRDSGVPREKSIIVPNWASSTGKNDNRKDATRFNLGLVGIIPAQKHLDKALDLLLELRKVDKRYKLFIKGRMPIDYPWMANRPDEMKYYNDQFARIETDPMLAGSVTFDAHGNDMDEWYEKIGFGLSLSDFESFHLTLADGSMNGAVPACLAWPGSDLIYPFEWISVDLKQMSDRIQKINVNPMEWRAAGIAAKSFVEKAFSSETVFQTLRQVTIGD